MHLLAKEFAGVVIEGDDLFDLHSEAQEVVEMLDIDDVEEAKQIAKTITERLGRFLERYEKASLAAGLQLAYTKTQPKK